MARIPTTANQKIEHSQTLSEGNETITQNQAEPQPPGTATLTSVCGLPLCEQEENLEPVASPVLTGLAPGPLAE